MKVYGCKAYAHIPKIPRLEKLAARANIGYLVGYNSTNIFRIWIPSLHKVIATRDVTFDELTQYEPIELNKEDKLQIKEIIEVIEMPTSTVEAIELDSDEEELIETYPKDNDTPIETASIEPLAIDETAEPESELEPELPEETTLATRSQLQKAPRDINLNIDESNIIKGRTRNARREAYTADLEHPDKYPGYHAAFTAGLEHNKRQSQLHRDNLPPPLQSWKKLQKHPYKEGFLAAANKEYQDLERRNTWKLTPKPTGNTQIIPLK